MEIASLLILSFTSPIVLVFIENWLPYPGLIEEITKWMIINWWMNQKQIKKNDWKLAVIVGLIFSLSENILYLRIIIESGSWILFPVRILTTSILHATTVVIIFLGVKKGSVQGMLALGLAVLIHFSYNFLLLRL